jgi:hypothetical protein
VIERDSLLPDAPWVWISLWVVKVILGVSMLALVAADEWRFALVPGGLFVLMLLGVIFGERLRLLPDQTQARIAEREANRRKPGESWLRHW